MFCAGLQMRDEGIEVRPSQYYTQHAAGIYQGAKPGKLRGLAHAGQSVHRVSVSLQLQVQLVYNNSTVSPAEADKSCTSNRQYQIACTLPIFHTAEACRCRQSL